MMADKDKARRKMSRQLTRLLRHSALDDGISMGKDGFVELDAVRKIDRFSRFDLEDFEKVVADDNKNRFSLTKRSDGKYYIRANQGHSIKVVESQYLLERVEEYGSIDVAIHGTYYKAWESIKTQGLSVMGRNHVHFACGLPEEDGVISGMRKSAQVLIYLDLEKVHEEGLPLFRSENNVLLSPGLENGIIPCSFFSKVIDRKTGEDLTLL
mmetsp:Transcript_1103/g.1740  ORF Transcript_1103/g.1740 Transcript_1103/m.1740 type:complete len:211 (-) Transcript_1103:476-1108(-)